MANPIHRQIKGLPLTENNDHKVEFVLKSKRGYPVMYIAGQGNDSRVRAEKEAAKRGLDLYRVTTITEKL